jgi:hypothetical protein
MKNEIYPIHMSGVDANGMFFQKEDWAYTCGHCTNVVVMRPDRLRPRTTCKACGRWICEKSELCNLDCTPMYSLAEDHFENAGKYGKFVSAIMKGHTKVEDAQKEGLIIGDV